MQTGLLFSFVTPAASKRRGETAAVSYISSQRSASSGRNIDKNSYNNGCLPGSVVVGDNAPSEVD